MFGFWSSLENVQAKEEKKSYFLGIWSALPSLEKVQTQAEKYLKSLDLGKISTPCIKNFQTQTTTKSSSESLD